MADDATQEATDHRDGGQANNEVETPETEQQETGQGAGSKAAVLADLATERDKRQALETQFNTLRDGLAAALGLGKEVNEATPEQLAEQLTTAQHEAQQARVELAVFRTAPDGVDAQALLDSRAFTNTISDIDPTDEAALTKAINDFTNANPRFQTGPRNPGHRDASSTSNGSRTARSMDDLLRGR